MTIIIYIYIFFPLLHDPLCVSRANGLCHWGRLCTATPVTAGGDYPVGVHATGRQPGSRRTAGAPHRRRARPRPGVRGESRPGRAAPRRIGRPNGARRPELPPSGGVLAQCGRGRAPRLGGSRRLPRPNDLLLRDLRWLGGSGASRKTRGRCVPACAGRLPGSPRPGSHRKRGAPVRCGQGGWRGSRRLPAEPRARAASRLRGLRSGVRRWPGPRGSCARAARWPRRGHRPRGRCGRPRVRWVQLVPGGRQWWRMRHGGRRKGRVPSHTDTGKGRSSRGLGAAVAARCGNAGCRAGIPGW